MQAGCAAIRGCVEASGGLCAWPPFCAALQGAATEIRAGQRLRSHEPVMREPGPQTSCSGGQASRFLAGRECSMASSLSPLQAASSAISHYVLCLESRRKGIKKRPAERGIFARPTAQVRARASPLPSRNARVGARAVACPDPPSLGAFRRCPRGRCRTRSAPCRCRCAAPRRLTRRPRPTRHPPCRGFLRSCRL